MTREDRLAEFTDRLLAGTSSPLDPQDSQESVLARLAGCIPSKAEEDRAAGSTLQPLSRFWMSRDLPARKFRSRNFWRGAAAGAALLLLVSALGVLLLQGGGAGPLPGAALQTTGLVYGLLIVSLLVLLVMIIGKRK